ncbi:DUF2291 family protein [Aliamphritea hakodatensis]|uniref:DUF2291 family protein n=1 Tax=Aliamphritea hakodatensis TaxID=2895352 RepID=UPI0022FD639D|nr:DUF2291 domain-containing protein [Aliamphritea hakodatensis]
MASVQSEFVTSSEKAAFRHMLLPGAIIALLAGMLLDTRIVQTGSSEDSRDRAFSPQLFGQSEFPRIRQYVVENAVRAEALYQAIIEDKAVAAENFGVKAGIGTIFPVAFEGKARESVSGVYRIEIDGMPPSHTVRLQTGPAINGTDLRDATGTVTFGQFTNQIEYQDAGSALNNAMKSSVLTGIASTDLTGRQLSVTGVFKLINPKNWLVTPVRLVVQ